MGSILAKRIGSGPRWATRQFSLLSGDHAKPAGTWQDGLRLDPPLEFFVQAFNGVGSSDRFPLAFWEAREGEQSILRFFQAIGDGAAFEPPFADERLPPCNPENSPRKLKIHGHIREVCGCPERIRTLESRDAPPAPGAPPCHRNRSEIRTQGSPPPDPRRKSRRQV
jgi:hypothetical protein